MIINCCHHFHVISFRANTQSKKKKKKNPFRIAPNGWSQIKWREIQHKTFFFLSFFSFFLSFVFSLPFFSFFLSSFFLSFFQVPVIWDGRYKNINNEMILKHRDSFGKEKKKFYILVIQYSKCFWTTFKLWTEVILTIWWLNHAKYTYRFNVIDMHRFVRRPSEQFEK